MADVLRYRSSDGHLDKELRLMYTGRKAIRKTMHVCVELGTLFLLCY